jgi:hypothetical protein
MTSQRRADKTGRLERSPLEPQLHNSAWKGTFYRSCDFGALHRFRLSFCGASLAIKPVFPKNPTRSIAPSAYEAESLTGARESIKAVNDCSPDSRRIDHLQPQSENTLDNTAIHPSRSGLENEQLMSQHDEMETARRFQQRT